MIKHRLQAENLSCFWGADWNVPRSPCAYVAWVQPLHAPSAISHKQWESHWLPGPSPSGLNGKCGSPVFRPGDLRRGWSSWCVKRCWFQDSIRLQGSVSTPAPPGPDSRLRVFPELSQVAAATCTYEGTQTHLLESGAPHPAPRGGHPSDTSRLGVFRITAWQSANGPHHGARGAYEIIWKSLWIHCHLPTWLWMKSKS